MPILTLLEHSLHYRIDGAGPGRPWLLFCNSLGTTLEMWDPQVEALGRYFRILRYDRRGHGLSTSPPRPFALSDLGEDVLKLLDSLGIERTHFCGLSIGGLVGQWLAINAPHRLDRIVLAATASRIGTAEGWQARREAVERDGLGPLRGATLERWFSPAFAAAHGDLVAPVLDAFVKTSVAGYAGCCAALSDADFTQALTTIPHPLLAVAGESDPVCPPADLESLALGVRDGRSMALPGRHIVNIEAADAFNSAVLAFLRGCVGAASCIPDQPVGHPANN